VRNPPEPTATAPTPPDSPPDAVEVRREKTSDDFPIEEPTEDELKQFAAMAEQEQLRQKIERIYGTGGANQDPAAGQSPAGGRAPPAI
jgi:hypothetical protein